MLKNVTPDLPIEEIYMKNRTSDFSLVSKIIDQNSIKVIS